MAFTKTPTTDTYQTKQIPLISQMNSRGSNTTTDVDYINCFPEYWKNKTTQQQEIRLRKRSGSSVQNTLVNTVTRGVHFWEDQSRVYIAQSNHVYVYNYPSLTLLTTLNNVYPTTSSGNVGFTEFLYEDGTIKIVTTDGITLSTIDSANTVVASADPDMPNPHVPQPIFLDGYLFILKTGTADLYNSDLNDPLAYTTGDFISSEMLPDKVTHLMRLNNYILVFGTDSIEYFWDAANDTGSPLQRNDTPVKLMSYIGGAAQIGNKIYFVGDNDRSQANVFVLEDFKVTPVGDEFIRRMLTANVSSTVYGNIVSIDGHDFYVMYVGPRTYVLEIETNIWHRWGFGNTDVFTMQFAINCRNSTNYNQLFIRLNDANLYSFGQSLYQDAGNNITTQWVTDNENFDTWNNKFMANLTVWADKPSSSSPLLVQWTDDDYQSYNTGVTVDLNQECPRIYRLGRFRRRAFKFTHTANQPMRIEKLETDINMGLA
jgi:hypothetical protein